HLTAEQRRELIDKLIKATPEKSDRQIAETVKASPTTVGTRRAKMEAKGEVSKLDTRTDAKGVKQPASKPRNPKPTEADQEAWDAGDISRAEAERRGINTRPAKTSVGQLPARARRDRIRKLDGLAAAASEKERQRQRHRVQWEEYDKQATAEAARL